MSTRTRDKYKLSDLKYIHKKQEELEQKIKKQKTFSKELDNELHKFVMRECCILTYHDAGCPDNDKFMTELLQT